MFTKILAIHWTHDRGYILLRVKSDGMFVTHFLNTLTSEGPLTYPNEVLLKMEGVWGHYSSTAEEAWADFKSRCERGY